MQTMVYILNINERLKVDMDSYIRLSDQFNEHTKSVMNKSKVEENKSCLAKSKIEEFKGGSGVKQESTPSLIIGKIKKKNGIIIDDKRPYTDQIVYLKVELDQVLYLSVFWRKLYLIFIYFHKIFFPKFQL